MVKKVKPSSKIVALIFVILMMGSGIGMIAGILTKPDTIKIPENKIIKYKLTDSQVKELLKNYYTVVEYEYPSGCIECGNLVTSLEQWTMSSDNQIYLQEIQTDTSSSSKITVISLRGQKTLYDPNQDDARNDICELLITSSLFCVKI